ncbi:MAG: hypothetical protein NZM25_01555 [Leptospiraceae bacterium]|nr:hypothetical protein [Leptospiraceae bacterium]MDW8307631.1 hypothetical protein [Leptospiraceae bacterium]
MPFKAQTFTSENELFELQYPRTWEQETYEGIPAFFDPFYGTGALQFFSLRIDEISEEELCEAPFLRGKTLQEKMALFLEENEVPYHWEELTAEYRNGQHFIAKEYYKEGRFYMVAMFEKEDVFVLSLFNSKGLPDPEEAQIVAEILQSVRLFS